MGGQLSVNSIIPTHYDFHRNCSRLRSKKKSRRDDVNTIKHIFVDLSNFTIVITLGLLTNKQNIFFFKYVFNANTKINRKKRSVWISYDYLFSLVVVNLPFVDRFLKCS